MPNLTACKALVSINLYQTTIGRSVKLCEFLVTFIHQLSSIVVSFTKDQCYNKEIYQCSTSGKFNYAGHIFQGVTSHQQHFIQNIGRPRSKHSKTKQKCPKQTEKKQINPADNPSIMCIIMNEASCLCNVAITDNSVTSK